ncbi:cytochrome P450 [Pseudonocardia pini]|uniref:cytochrome P450 n=1 Tax=Pseudonocardia pini TaxID=2758030 RepID=UPI0015F07770|nr:cytochrome P450 [Pseudonocardia pini]
MSIEHDAHPRLEGTTYSPAAEKDAAPWAPMAETRGRCPVGHSADLDAVMVTSYKGVREVLKNTSTFSSRWYTSYVRDEELPLDEQVLSFTDPPRHTRHRKLLTASLSASKVERWRAVSEEVVNGLIDGFADSTGPVDYLTAFGKPFPAEIIGQLFGIPEEDRELFMAGSEASELLTSNPEKYGPVVREFRDQIELRVAQRRERGGLVTDDLLAALCFAEVNGDRFTDKEVAGMVRLLVSAGNTTTTALVGNIIHALDRFPEQKALFLSDIDRYVDSVVEEGLRYDGPILGLFRRSTTTDSIQGCPAVREGDKVYSSYSAASHDPEQYDRPDEFIADRDWSKLPSHLGFGYGIHHCIGANLARLEAQVALKALYTRLPNLRVSDATTPTQFPGPVFRGWLGLSVEFDQPVRGGQ